MVHGKGGRCFSSFLQTCFASCQLSQALSWRLFCFASSHKYHICRPYCPQAPTASVYSASNVEAICARERERERERDRETERERDRERQLFDLSRMLRGGARGICAPCGLRPSQLQTKHRSRNFTFKRFYSRKPAIRHLQYIVSLPGLH